MKRLLLLAMLIGFLAGADAYHLFAQPASARPATKGVWVRIPIRGMIGKDFTADDMRGGIQRAKSARADVIVLELDTPGGGIDTAEQIIDMIIRARDIRFVAVVHRALSAGAAITLACPDVFTTETATIGAATSFMADARGIVDLPKDVAEKFQSAWRAVCHMQVWLRACSVDTSAGSLKAPAVSEVDPADETKAGNLLKMAEMYQANKKPKLAKSTLEILVEQYPKTKAAAKAKLQLGVKD